MNIHNTSSDYDTILALLQDYFDGLYEGDTEKLRNILGPSRLQGCTLIRNGALTGNGSG